MTFGQLLREVSQLSHVLKDLGVQKGDIVAIYLPNIAEALVAMLACARIGAVHSVVFMGFSAASLRDRILDARSKLIITTDEARRGGKTIPTKVIVDEALLQCPQVHSCLVLKHTNSSIPWCSSRDFWWHEEARKWPAYYSPESMSAEDPLFILYTSGSTGKPKGLIHTTAGFLLGAMMTTQYVFDMQENDRHFCAGDVGWITGHTYLVYGPLLVGATTVIFEGTPAYPSFSRFWDIVDEHRVTHFYAAPTALRILKRAGDSHVTAPMKDLRVLGSIGEPIAPEVWKWYSEVVGRNRAAIVDVSM
ncbi:acetyl-coenzyme A synthetase 2 [Clarireedia jacksonii]